MDGDLILGQLEEEMSKSRSVGDRRRTAAVARPEAVANEKTSLSDEYVPTLAERRTEEIVFGMVGPIGSGVSYTSQLLAEILQNEFGYKGEILKLSQLINESAKYVGKSSVSDSDPERIRKLQDLGNELRRKYGKRYLADLCVREINMRRGDVEGLPQSRRYFTILDSVKHPEEVLALREVYEDAFWLIGVFAPEGVRKARLRSFGKLSEAQIVEVLNRDQYEDLDFGQSVRTTMELADFYVRNDGVNDTKVRAAVTRFLEIMFGIGVQTPTRDELAMQAAAAMSAGSACLSRQVGAVIMSKDGEIIGQGTNDVPKFGGGLYSNKDETSDNRCWRWKNRECHNDARKSSLLTRIEGKLKEANALRRNVGEEIRLAVAKAGVKDLIEFSRAVHAEMEAIISVARSGKSGIVGATLYSTTFPCHNCARHIVASGIKKVIYIEPYPKSLALELHDDSITTDEDQAENKVVFLQYEGVAPRDFIRLFGKSGERKVNGRFRNVDRRTSVPIARAPLDSFVTREQLIVAKLGKQQALPGEDN
jgi:deoxycytidylate deaminase